MLRLARSISLVQKNKEVRFLKYGGRWVWVGWRERGVAVIILSCVLTRALIKLFAGCRADRDKLRTD